MPFASWWRGDTLPDLPPIPGLSVRPVSRWAEAQLVTGLTEHRVLTRYQNANALYGAFLDGEPAGYGWLARQTGRIDELLLVFEMPRGETYLWDFVTLPAFRGRGVYPHLLQEITRQEEHLSRFWIGYDGANLASGRGIEKAGFRVVGDLVVQGGLVTGLTVADTGERGQAFVDLFGLPIVDEG
jgi:GNAT superfamily N-acetyltransferase